MFGNIITTIFVILLIVLLVNPQLLKFLKRPTRWKAFWLWFIAYCVIINIYHLTPTGKAEYAELIANQLQKEEIYTPKPDTTKHIYIFPFLPR